MGNFSIRKIILMASDMFIVFLAAVLSNFFLSLFGIACPEGRLLFYSVAVDVVLCFLALFAAGVYRIMWRYVDKRCYIKCLAGTTTGTVLSCLVLVCFGYSLPLVFVITRYMICNTGIILFRFLFKDTFLVIADSAKTGSDKKRTIIIGAGQASRMIISEIQNAVNEGRADNIDYIPVCIVDDNAELTGSQINGVRVVGTTRNIVSVCEREKIELIIFAIPSVDEDERKKILDICSETKLPIKVIPFLSQMIFDDNNTGILSQVKDIKVEELLGREPVTFNREEVMSFISGSTVMVTGGGGSIGSELVRQIARYSPKQVIIVDIYENNAYEIQQELVMEYGDSLGLVTLIASVRDYDRMSSIFDQYRPDIVFHAAAHKHVPLMEDSPQEAVKNNILGTFNMATLSDYYRVRKFVMISTDKAVNPTNVMGASKRCCEMIVQYMSQQKDVYTDFVTTRFGNVLGSNGSVIPLFRRQIESGRPVTVTHPDIIRYFMTIPEAVSLVLQAGSMADGGEIFVLDMGAPVKITTLAENLIRMYGKVPYKDVEIKFTGLRPGEKLFEELLMDEEGLKKTNNKKIFIGNQIDIDEDDFINKLSVLKQVALDNNEELTVACLAGMVPTFRHKEFKNITMAG
ncbi:MAG: nucleoside-diphosphate sugar epimerase/dehydratase [Oscillospiraceae bacterium]|nr:nucleoside-diphosphate sugar epimerase/dehydratase [Oscillospiraceae bacterium]